MSLIKPKLTFSLFIFIGFGAFSQSNSQKEIFEAYDNIVGLDNTGLYNGTEFEDPFLNTDGTYRYFKGFDYVEGSVEYNGQFYFNVLLKYDLLEDNLLTHSNDNLGVFNVKLIPEFIKSFSIYNHNFIRLEGNQLPFTGNGFFEEAFLGTHLSLYIKHTKKKKDKPLKNGIQYKFSDHIFYVLKTNGNYSMIEKAKDIWKILPEREEKIREFSKSYKVLSKSNPNSFMVKLVDYLDGLDQIP